MSGSPGRYHYSPAPRAVEAAARVLGPGPCHRRSREMRRQMSASKGRVASLGEHGDGGAAPSGSSGFKGRAERHLRAFGDGHLGAATRAPARRKQAWRLYGPLALRSDGTRLLTPSGALPARVRGRARGRDLRLPETLVLRRGSRVLLRVCRTPRHSETRRLIVAVRRISSEPRTTERGISSAGGRGAASSSAPASRERRERRRGATGRRRAPEPRRDERRKLLPRLGHARARAGAARDLRARRRAFRGARGRPPAS